MVIKKPGNAHCIKCGWVGGVAHQFVKCPVCGNLLVMDEPNNN